MKGTMDIPTKLSPVGEVIEYHYTLTQYKETSAQGTVKMRGYTHYSQLARDADIDPSYLWYIRHGEKIRVNTAVWWDLAIALANGQVQAGKCAAQEMVGRAKFIVTQLTTTLLELPVFATFVDERIADLNERRAIAEIQKYLNRQSAQEQREDKMRERDSAKRKRQQGKAEERETAD